MAQLMGGKLNTFKEPQRCEVVFESNSDSWGRTLRGNWRGVLKQLKRYKPDRKTSLAPSGYAQFANNGTQYRVPLYR